MTSTEDAPVLTAEDTRQRVETLTRDSFDGDPARTRKFITDAREHLGAGMSYQGARNVALMLAALDELEANTRNAGHRLTEETIARFREDGAAAMHAGEPNSPDHRTLFRLALADIPPGFRENGVTVTALREQWHHGYAGAARLQLAERYGDQYETALRAEWSAMCGGDAYAGLLCVAVKRAAPGFERDECRADLRQYFGDTLDAQREDVQRLATG